MYFISVVKVLVHVSYFYGKSTGTCTFLTVVILHNLHSKGLGSNKICDI